MPLAQDWQCLINGLTLGSGTPYLLSEEMIGGLGVPEPKTVYVDLTHGDGSYPGPPRKSPRVVTIPLVVLGSSPSNTMALLDDLREAWTQGPAEVSLEVRLPGLHVTMNGHPTDLSVDLALLKTSTIYCLGSFIALDPTLTPV